jgi:hypothetical protein
MQVERGGRTQITWEMISSSFELGSEHGERGWKDQEEKNGIETLYEGIDSLKKNIIFTPHHGCVIVILIMFPVEDFFAIIQIRNA